MSGKVHPRAIDAWAMWQPPRHLVDRPADNEGQQKEMLKEAFIAGYTQSLTDTSLIVRRAHDLLEMAESIQRLTISINPTVGDKSNG